MCAYISGRKKRNSFIRMLVCFRPEKVERVSLLWSVMYSLRFNMKNNVHSTINVQDHIAPTECLQ